MPFLGFQDWNGNRLGNKPANDGGPAFAMSMFPHRNGKAFPDGTLTAWTTPQFVDIDNDGDYDLLLCGSQNFNPGTFPPELWINGGDKTFTKNAALPASLTASKGICAVGDVDNDGRLDIFSVTHTSSGGSGTKVVLHKQSAAGVFTEVTAATLVFNQASNSRDVKSMALGDYNNDGYLDLLLGNYKQSGGLANELFKNNGDGTFTAVSNSITFLSSTKTRSVAFGDYDGDGRVDVLVGNEGGVNELHRNNGGDHFTNIIQQQPTSGFADTWAVAFADLDSDGDAELIFGNQAARGSNAESGPGLPNEFYFVNRCGRGGNAIGETCFACPPYSNRIHANVDVCEECPAFMVGGSAGCGFCPSGTTRVTGEYECTAVQIGSYANALSSGPQLCAAGRYGDATGRVDEKCSGACAAGHYCPAGSTNATAVVCPSGTYNDALGGDSVASCRPCPQGSYCPAGTVNPISCLSVVPAGTTDGPGAAAATDCACAASYYRKAVVAAPGANATAPFECIACPADSTVCNRIGMTLESLHLKPDFYRMFNGSEATWIMPCLTPGACLGGPNMTTSGSPCLPGQIGPFCQVCDDGFFGGKEGSLCRACSGDIGLAFVPAILLFLALALMIVYFVRGGKSLETAAALGEELAESGAADGDVSGAMQGMIQARLEEKAEGADAADAEDAMIDLAFESLDRDEDGFVTVDELHAKLVVKAPELSLEKVQDFWQRMLDTNVDTNKDGQVSTAEISDWWKARKAMLKPKNQRTIKERMLLFVARAAAKWAKVQVKVKILISLYQILQGIGGVFAIPFPPFYDSVVGGMGSIFQINLPTLMPAECIASSAGVSMNFRFILILQTMLPLFIYATFACGSAVFHRLGNEWKSNVLIDAIFFVMFLVYPGVSAKIFAAFPTGCDTLEDGSAYLRADLSMRCWSTDGLDGAYFATFIFALVMLVVHVIGTPAVYIYLFFFKHRAALEALKEQELDDAYQAKLEADKTYVDKKTVAIAPEGNQPEKPRLDPAEELPGYLRKLTGGCAPLPFELRSFSCPRATCSARAFTFACLPCPTHRLRILAWQTSTALTGLRSSRPCARSSSLASPPPSPAAAAPCSSCGASSSASAPLAHT
jgi:hypothetical protein